MVQQGLIFNVASVTNRHMFSTQMIISRFFIKAF